MSCAALKFSFAHNEKVATKSFEFCITCSAACTRCGDPVLVIEQRPVSN